MNTKTKKTLGNNEDFSAVQADEVVSAEEISEKDVIKKPKAWIIPAIIIGATLYAVCPIDLIPDPIPIVGWMDDLAVILIAVAQLKNETDKRKKWKNNAQR